MSHSSSARSTSSSSLTSSIGVRPGTRNAPLGSRSTTGSSTSYSSVISPTISSSRSSIVTSPAVPPYSSTTIAMWNFSVCISRSSSATRFDSGTKCAGRRLWRTGSEPSPAAAARDEVLQEHEPDDVVESCRRTRAAATCPALIAVSIASSTVASASTATMSVRGSITSRTTVSPNSKIEWMSSRSSVSIASSCGGDVGHRQDLFLGDERARAQALARQHDVGDPDEAAGRARAAARSA